LERYDFGQGAGDRHAGAADPGHAAVDARIDEPCANTFRIGVVTGPVLTALTRSPRSLNGGRERPAAC
jgi:hypothetical protein